VRGPSSLRRRGLLVVPSSAERAAVGRWLQFLGGELPKMAAEIILAPRFQDLSDFLPIDAETIGDVVERGLARSVSMVVDLDRDRALFLV
jgi:hypothetical protein